MGKMTENHEQNQTIKCLVYMTYDNLLKIIQILMNSEKNEEVGF